MLNSPTVAHHCIYAKESPWCVWSDGKICHGGIVVGKRSDVHEFSCNIQSWQGWHVCIVEIESKLDKVFCHVSDNSKPYDKCKFDLKLIRLLTISNLFPLKLCRDANFANFVYYEKTRM